MALAFPHLDIGNQITRGNCGERAPFGINAWPQRQEIKRDGAWQRQRRHAIMFVDPTRFPPPPQCHLKIWLSHQACRLKTEPISVWGEKKKKLQWGQENILASWQYISLQQCVLSVRHLYCDCDRVKQRCQTDFCCTSRRHGFFQRASMFFFI